MTAENESDSRSRKSRRWITAATLLIILVIVFLPTIGSLGPVRRMVLRKVNARLDGTANVDKWSLSWFGGLAFSGVDVSINSPQATTSFQAPEIKISSGLLRLLGNTKNLGRITVAEPVLIVVLPDSPASGAAEAGAAPTKVDGTAQSQAAPSRRPADRPAQINTDVRAEVKIENGRIAIASAGGKDTAFELEQIDADIDISSLNESVSFSAGAGQVGSPGVVKLEGTTRLLQDGQFKPEELLAQATVSLNRFDLAGPAAAARSFGPVPDTAGTLISDIKLNMNGIRNIRAEGLIQLLALSLKGGPLGNDSPEFDKISLIFDVSCDGNGLAVRRLDLSSPVLTAHASGELQQSTGYAYPSGKLNMKTELDVAQIAARFPDTLNMKPGLKVSRGSVAADAAIQGSGRQLSFVCNAVTRDIAATQDGQQVLFEEPITFAVKGSLDQNKGLTLEEFTLDSPFARAKGSGTPEDLAVNISADLAAAIREARKFVDLKDADATGRLSADMGIEPSSAKTGQVAITAVLEELKINRANIHEPRITVSASADVTADTVKILNLKLNSGLARLDCSGTFSNMHSTRDLTLSGKLGIGLDKLGAMLTAMAARPFALEGNELRDFAVKTRLSGTNPAEILNSTEANATVYVKRLKTFGIETTPADLKIALKSGTAKIEFKTGANGGTVSLPLHIDVAAEPMMLTMPDASLVLKDVRLNDELSSEVLALIHPLFRGCAVLGGKVGLNLETCAVPLSPADRNNIKFAGKVQLTDILLSAGGVIGDIAGLMDQEIKTISIPSQEISVQCENGRVTPSPLTVGARGYSVVFSGSVGLDGSMDYMAEIPLTEQIVRNAAAYEYLKETRVRLPIRGTVTRPEVSRDALLSTAGELVKEALKKTAVNESKKVLKDLLEKEGRKSLQNLLDSVR